MAYELTRLNPGTELVLLQENLNCLLGNFWGRTSWRGLALDGFWAPAMDVEETKDELVVTVEVPGLRREDIKVHAQGNTLTITGERKQEAEKMAHLVERGYGKFQRVIGLPAEVEGTRARATYEQGVLTIHLPKSEQAKPKEIAIEVR